MHHQLTKILGAALAALIMASASSQAGPGPQVFVPVKTAAQAEALPAKTQIAVTCPSCGAVSISTVDKAKTHMHAFNCTSCKHTYSLEAVGSGKASAGKLVCRDTATGKTMPLHMCAKMHH
jgi:predicted RNA-binding Zn-ribbon protein involved in translation (DUF1610 family)